MLTEGELKDYMDDIIHQIEKNQWVKSYNIFMQSILKKELTSIRGINNDLMIDQLGIAVRLISYNRRLREISYSYSMSSELSKLTEPKSTQDQISLDEFPSLEQPKLTSIVGDGSKQYNPIDDLHEFIPQIETDYEDPNNLVITRSLNTIHERRIITTTGSVPIQDELLKTRFSVTHQLFERDTITFGKESFFGRNLNFDPLEFDQKARIELGKNMMKIPEIWQGDVKGVLLHPQVIGQILSSFIHRFVLKPQSKDGWEWNNDIQIYDDAHRESGFSSMIVDDEGSLTQSKLLLQGGKISNTLDDLRSSGWKSGGSGFRTSFYQPLVRSFRYPISRFYTNLSVYGGIGRGEHFTDRNGVVLEITDAQAYVVGDVQNPFFVVHARESYIWNNGEFLGPSKKTFLSGSISELMKYGQFSSDQHLVVKNDQPGSIYTGWVYIQTSFLNIRWN